MAYTETTTTSYGSRLNKSIKGIGGGFTMFILGTVLLFWNEGRTVKTTKMLNEAQQVCIEMPSAETIDPKFEGELVCASAMVESSDSLVDSQYGIGAKAIALIRKVEYYQWTEHSHTKTEEKVGGKEVTTTTYTYTQEWVPVPVQSSKFHDPEYRNSNFVLANVESSEVWAENVSFGAYSLNEDLIHRISSTEAMTLDFSDEFLKTLNQHALLAVRDSLGSAQLVHVNSNELYYGLTPSAARVGDVRVTFEKIVPAKATVVSVADGDSFRPYVAANGESFQTLVMGKKSIPEIFESEHSSNKTQMWIFRLIGIFLVITGLKGIFNILSTLLKVIPFLANIVNLGVGLVCSIVGFAWSIIVIAVAWVSYRPVLGISLLAVAAALIAFFAVRGRKMKPEKE